LECTALEKPEAPSRLCPATLKCMMRKPKDCELTEWSHWSACSKTCGPGVQWRHLKILDAPRFGGKQCPRKSALEEKRPCNERKCPEWKVQGPSKSKKCDMKCGRPKSYTIEGNLACYDPETKKVLENIFCNADDRPSYWSYNINCKATKPCPVDCKVTPWSAWSECNADCGEGKHQRYRKIVQKDEHGGKACPTNLFETGKCQKRKCTHADYMKYMHEYIRKRW
jgi:hypothetical protein